MISMRPTQFLDERQYPLIPFSMVDVEDDGLNKVLRFDRHVHGLAPWHIH